MKTSLFIILILFTRIVLLQAAVYNIIDFGAVENENCTDAIQKAVDKCHEAGGGMVLVPEGRYITGTIELKSYVNLHLESGAVLQGSLDLEDYKVSFRTHGIIFCFDAEQVSITGEGMIDARGTHFYDPSENHVSIDFDRSVTRQKDNYLPDGIFQSDGPIKRLPKPGMAITFYHCSRVRLKDFILKDTPSWAIRLAYCEDVLVDGISIKNNLMVPNSDGVHCTVSSNVRIVNCDIRAGDDAIIFTGFSLEESEPRYTMEAQNARQFGNKSEYSENLSVSNCHLQSRSSGIRIGYGQHPIRRGTFTNIQIYGSNRGIGIFAHDLSDITDLVFSDIVIQTRLHNGHWWGNGEPIHLSAISRFEGESAGYIRNIQFNNIIATSEHGILLYGKKDSRLEDISFRNVRLHIVKGRETLSYGGNFDLRPTAFQKEQIFKHDIPGIYAQYVDGLSLEDFSLKWDENLPDFFTYALQTDHVKDLYILRMDAKAHIKCENCETMDLNFTTFWGK
jgi:polygalacturonase